MTAPLRGILLASALSSLLFVTACATTQDNSTNVSESARVNSILERAAKEAKASGNKVEALILLEKIYERNPDDAAVATSFGQALREDEQLNRARQILFPFTEGKNAYTDAVIELAMVQLALGQYKDAELTARRSVEMDEKSGRAFLALGTALDAQNYHEQAEVAFRRGIENWKGDPAPIMNNLALNLASQNKLDQAIDMLLKAKEISSGRVEIERNLRIIRTLKETATEFTEKKEQAQKAPVVKKEPAKVEPAKAEPLETAPPKAEPVKKVEEKPVVTKPKVEPAKATEKEVTTNKRGSKQNFNSSNTAE